jgi:anti-anti-sigma regulatory factor
MNEIQSPSGYEQTQTRQELVPGHDYQNEVVLTMDPFLQDQAEVIVRQVPERLSSEDGQKFFHQVQKLLCTTQPRFVFDFTHVRKLDVVGIDVLLQCLKEVMKLNGDVKLAAVRRGPAAILARTGVDSLFETFDSAAEAMRSFDPFPLHGTTMEVPVCASQSRSTGNTSYMAD